MKRLWIPLFACTWVLYGPASPALGQKNTCQTSDSEVAYIVKSVEGDAKANNGDPHSLDLFATYAYWDLETAKAVAANSAKATAAQSRTDQQTTASSGAAGSTSTTSKGSVPWLLGLAEEYGGVTQSVSGSTTSVNGNVTNVIKAINKKEYVQSYNAWPENPVSEAVENASFSLAFNTGSSSSSTQSSISPSSFSSATAHIDFYNKRDPRNKKWTGAWTKLANSQGALLAGSGTAYGSAVGAKSALKPGDPGYISEYAAIGQWSQEAKQKLGALITYLSSTKDSQTDQDTRTKADLTSIWSDFNSKVCSLDAKSPDLSAADAQLQASLKSYMNSKSDVTSQINKSPVFSFEYTFTNQSSVALPKSTTQTYAIGTTAPDLSNFNLIFQMPLGRNGSNQLTVNAGTTLFTAPSAQLHLNLVRDFKASAEADFSLPAFVQLAKSTISISALVQDLLQEPLGQQVTVNGVSVTNTGTIVLGQAKWTFPAGSSGITFPVSFTAGNRTDLIKETTVKGTIGISYNLDSLLAQTAK